MKTTQIRTWPVALCAALTIVAAAPAADDPSPPKQTAHQEIPDDQPAAAADLPVRTSPPASVPARGSLFGAVQVNVNSFGMNILGDAANEPSIAVDPTDPNRIVIGWRQFDTIESNFRQAGWAWSNDGGRTWRKSTLDPGVFRSDPVLGANADGVFFYNSLTLRDDLYLCDVFPSYDGGISWQPFVNAYGGDKQWMTIDRTDGIGRNHMYCVWNNFFSCCDGHFTVSFDSGATWEDPIDVPGFPYWGTLAVGPDGELYVAGQGFIVAKSTTLRDSSLPPAFDFVSNVDLGGQIGFSVGPNPAGLLGQASVAVNYADGPDRGHVYLLCSVDPPGSDPMDVRFARSIDGGQTWGPSIRVNLDLELGSWQWFGTMSVAPNGRIDAIWNDTRKDPGGFDSELYYAFSTDGGQSWSPGVVLTPAFDPHIGWPQQDKIGDYYDMISDNVGADLAFSATFNGEQDVYYIRIGDYDCNRHEPRLQR
jgi:hypothetical protein